MVEFDGEPEALEQLLGGLIGFRKIAAKKQKPLTELRLIQSCAPLIQPSPLQKGS